LNYDWYKRKTERKRRENLSYHYLVVWRLNHSEVIRRKDKNTNSSCRAIHIASSWSLRWLFKRWSSVTTLPSHQCRKQYLSPSSFQHTAFLDHPTLHHPSSTFNCDTNTLCNVRHCDMSCLSNCSTFLSKSSNSKDIHMEHFSNFESWTVRLSQRDTRFGFPYTDFLCYDGHFICFLHGH